MKIRLGCFAVIMAAIVIVIFAISIQAFFIQLGWNYVVVDGLNLATTKMTFKIAIVAALALSTIGVMFRTTVSKSK